MWEVPIRVRYSETDQMGVAYHAQYLVWLDVARTEVLDRLGYGLAQMESQGFFFMVIDASVKYRRPVLFDQVITVRLRLGKVSRSSVEFLHEIHHPETGLQAEAKVVLACVGKNKKLVKIPQKLREKFLTSLN